MTDETPDAEPTLTETLDKLREAFRPVFDAQREEWEREGPAAMAAFEATGATLDSIGGNCPVQAYGTVDGRHFYFRARGDSWEFHVGSSPDDAIMAPVFSTERDYGSWPEAGWMPKHEALGFIVEAIAAYRSGDDQRPAAPAGE